MKVLAYDTYQNADLVTDTCQYVDLDTLFISHVIALHAPYSSRQKESSTK